jgi:hypothetical protein
MAQILDLGLKMVAYLYFFYDFNRENYIIDINNVLLVKIEG